MGNCFSCTKKSDSDNDIIRLQVDKETNRKTWLKEVESDLRKLATPDETEKSLKHLYLSPSKRESAISHQLCGENVHASAGELAASRSTLSSFFDHTCDDLSPELSKSSENAKANLQEKRDEDVPSATSEVKQQIQSALIQEPTKLVDIDQNSETADCDETSASSNDLDEANRLLQDIDAMVADNEPSVQPVESPLIQEPRKQVNIDQNSETADCDETFVSSDDLDEANRLLQDIDTMIADGEPSVQPVDGFLDAKSNKVEDMDASEPHPKDSVSSLFNDEETKLIEEILREDQQRVMKNAAAEDEIELTADLCLHGTSIRMDPSSRPNTEVPDDGDSDGLEEEDDNSASEATEEDDSSSEMDGEDAILRDFRDDAIFYDDEESEMSQDILGDDQHRAHIDASPEDDIDLTVAGPVAAGVFLKRVQSVHKMIISVDTRRLHARGNDLEESEMFRDILREDSGEEDELEDTVSISLPAGVLHSTGDVDSDAEPGVDTESFGIDDLLSINSGFEVDTAGLPSSETRMGIEANKNNNARQMEAAFSSELEEDQIDAIVSRKIGRDRSRQRQDSRESRQKVSKHDEVQGSVSIQRNAGDTISSHYDEEELKLIDDILEATAAVPTGTSIEMSEEADVSTVVVSDKRPLEEVQNDAAKTEAREAAPTCPQISGLQEQSNTTRQQSILRPKTRRGRAECQEFGESGQQRQDLYEIRPQTRRSRLETREHSLQRPKTRRGRTEAPEIAESDQQRQDLYEMRPRTRRGRLETPEHTLTRPKTRRGRKGDYPGLSGVGSSVGAHGDSTTVFYDDEESNLMHEILREEETKRRNDESFMDEIVATAELSRFEKAGRQ